MNSQQLVDTEIYLPDYSEQMMISSFINKLDNMVQNNFDYKTKIYALFIPALLRASLPIIIFLAKN
ncbi:MAG TPA: hypothetical protein VF220_08660 [Nitrososphaeraceae archaeon]